MAEGRRSRTGSAAVTPVSTPSLGRRTASSTSNRRSKSRSSDDSEDGAGVKNLGREMQGAGEDSSESQGGRGAAGRPFAAVLTQDTIETQRHIQHLMWYLIAVAGLDVNLGRQGNTQDLETQIMHQYNQLVEPFSEAYFAYMTHEDGGNKDHLWTKGHDAAWLCRRLQHKTAATEGHTAKKIDAGYLWQQYKELSREIQNEAHLAWVEVTHAGTHEHASGEAVIELHDRWLQMFFEKQMEAKCKSKTAEDK